MRSLSLIHITSPSFLPSAVMTLVLPLAVMVTHWVLRTISPMASLRAPSRRASTETHTNFSLSRLTISSVHRHGSRPPEPAAQHTVCGGPPAPDQTNIGLPSWAALTNASSRLSSQGDFPEPRFTRLRFDLLPQLIESVRSNRLCCCGDQAGTCPYGHPSHPSSQAATHLTPPSIGGLLSRARFRLASPCLCRTSCVTSFLAIWRSSSSSLEPGEYRAIFLH